MNFSNRLYIILCLILVNAQLAVGQINLNPISTGLYVTSFNQDTKKASKMGIGISLSMNKFYMDFSGNFATGKGEYLAFNSQYTYPADKVNILVFNIGYILSVKSFNIIPFIGVGISSDIYQDPVGWDTYFMDEGVNNVSIGIIGAINLSPNVRIQAGVGNYELFKAGISYVWE
jgi:hypothetical protein